MMFKSGENSNIRLRAANFYNQCKIYNQRHPLLCVILTILFLVFFFSLFTYVYGQLNYPTLPELVYTGSGRKT